MKGRFLLLSIPLVVVIGIGNCLRPPNKPERVKAFAGPDTTVFARTSIRLHGSYTGENVEYTAWQIGYSNPFRQASPDTAFKAPAEPGTLPCVFLARDKKSVTSRDTMIVTIVRDTSIPNGVSFRGMGVVTEKPSKISFTFSLCDEDGKFLAIPSNEIQKIFRIHEKLRTEKTYKEIDYSETSFFIVDNGKFIADVCLVLDFTKSMESTADAIPTMVSSAKRLIDSLHEQSKIAVVEYHDRNAVPSVLASMSLGHAGAKTAIDNFANGAILHGSSRVWDAINIGTEEFKNSTEKVRALVVLTDGNETSSGATVQQAVAFAQSKGVRIYPIAYGSVLEENREVLEQVAKATGGAVYSAGDAAMLSEKFKAIASGIGAQCAVSYISLQTKGIYDVKLTAEYAHDTAEYVAGVIMDSIYADDRIGVIVIDSVKKIGADGSALVSVNARHVPRKIDHFEFTLNTPKTVTVRCIDGLCKGWSIETLGNNHFRISSPTPIPFGKYGMLWQMEIAKMSGNGVSIPFALNNDYDGGRKFLYPDFISIGSGVKLPVVDAGNDTSVGMNDTIRLKGTAHSPDSLSIVQYGWRWDSTGWHVTATPDTFFIAPPAIPVKNPYRTCSFRAMDAEGVLGYDSLKVSVVSMPPKAIPKVKDSVVGPGDTVRCIGSQSTDEGRIVKYEWKFGADTNWITVSKGDTNIIAPSKSTAAFPCFLRVTDEDGEKSKGTDYVRVYVVSRPPVALPKALKTDVGLNDTIHLTGSESKDDGTIVKYEWRFGADTNWVTVSKGDTNIFAPSTPTAAYRCYLRVTDDDGEQDNSGKYVQIRVLSSPPNAIARIADTLGVGLNDTIHFVGSKSTDNGSIIKYEWKFGDNPWVTVSKGDTNILPLISTPAYTCSLRVTDDDLETDVAYLIIPISLFTLLTDKAEFTARHSHAAAVHAGAAWIIGGFDGAWKSDVWSSPTGVTWTKVTGSANFPERSEHTCVSFKDKIWVIGGRGPSYIYKDIWRSSDGITWDTVTTNAAFGYRYGHTCVVFKDTLWLIGGKMSLNAYKNDVWYSADGITWDTATNSGAFPARFAHTSLVYANKVWIIAGNNGGSDFNDVWSSVDGKTWTLAAAHAQFPIRKYHTSVMYDNKIWVIGGEATAPYKDAWYSSDGVAWTEAAKNAGFNSRSKHASVVFQDKILVINGMLMKTDVWFYKKP